MEGSRPQWLAVVWFPILSAIVAGPLLGAGYLLLLDYPAGPRFPTYSMLPAPSAADLGNSTPLFALEGALRGVHTYLPDKLLLLAPIVVGGLGLFSFLFRRLGLGTMAALYGGTLFVINPFVTDRYLAGHLHFLLGYSLLPWALGRLWDCARSPSRHQAIPVAVWLFVLGVVDVHIAGIYGLLVVVVLLLGRGGWQTRLAATGWSLGLAILLSAFWILYALGSAPGSGIGASDLEVYASRPRGYGVMPSLLSMYGFWREEFASAADRVPALYLLLVFLLGLAIVGLTRLFDSADHRFFLGLSVSAVLALVLAAGISFPITAGLFRWLFEQIPGMGVYREPQKFLALVILAYAVFGAIGLEAVTSIVNRLIGWRQLPGTIASVAIVAVLAYGFTAFWGFWNQVHLSRYPDSWYEAAARMKNRGAGRIVVLPWNLYAVWTFSDGRLVANPAGSFFAEEVLSSAEAGFASVPDQSPDPFRAYVQDILDHRDVVHSLGHVVAPLGVRFVVLLREVDHWQYAFLRQQRDLAVLYQSPELAVYENLEWEPVPLKVEEGVARSLSSVLGSPREESVTDFFQPSSPLAGTYAPGFPPLVRPLPIWSTLEPASGAPFTVAPLRCTDGWWLGTELSRCHLGATAAFRSPVRPELLWRPIVGLRLLGLVLTIVSATATILIWRRNRLLPSDMAKRLSDIDSQARTEEKDRRSRRVTPAEAVVLVGLAAVVALVSFQLTTDKDREVFEPTGEKPVQGAACLQLSAAFRAHQSEDEAALETAVRVAARQAEAALDDSGQQFGAPERAALELSFILDEEGYSAAEVERWLERGLRACPDSLRESPTL